jgi:hypothetical protein
MAMIKGPITAINSDIDAIELNVHCSTSGAGAVTILTSDTGATTLKLQSDGNSNDAVDIEATAAGVTITAATSIFLEPGSGTVDVNSKKITSCADPASAQDVATQNYVLTNTATSGSNKQQSTGILSGGLLSINADDTKFDVAAGTGVVEAAGVITYVTWSALTAQDPTHNGGVYIGGKSHVFIDSGGAVVTQKLHPSNSEIRNNIFIGMIVHTDNISITDTHQHHTTVLNIGSQLHDLMDSIGYLNLSGNVPAATGGALKFIISAGTAFIQSSNFISDSDDPHISTLSAADTSGSDTFTYIYSDDSTDISVTDITSLVPGNWDQGTGFSGKGSVTDNYSTQRIYRRSSGEIYIQPGQATYSTLKDAVGSIKTEDFTIAPLLTHLYILIGFISIKGIASNVSDTNTTAFHKSDKFGVASVTGSVTTLQNAYDNTGDTPLITTSTTGVGIVIKRGSSLDTNTVLEIQNGNGDAQATFAGDSTTFGSAVTCSSDLIIAAGTTPTNKSSAGTIGEIRWSTTHIYIYTATDAWKRVALVDDLPS